MKSTVLNFPVPTLPATFNDQTAAGVNLAQSGTTVTITDSSNVSSADGEILITLVHERSRSTQDIVRALRATLPRAFPELSFYFQPADIVTQILNFGLPSPIDVQISGARREDADQFSLNI